MQTLKAHPSQLLICLCSSLYTSAAWPPMAVAYLMTEGIAGCVELLITVSWEKNGRYKIHNTTMMVGLFKPKDNAQLGYPWDMAGSSLCLLFKSPSSRRFFPKHKAMGLS